MWVLDLCGSKVQHITTEKHIQIECFRFLPSNAIPLELFTALTQKHPIGIYYQTFGEVVYITK